MIELPSFLPKRKNPLEAALSQMPLSAAMPQPEPQQAEIPRQLPENYGIPQDVQDLPMRPIPVSPSLKDAMSQPAPGIPSRLDQMQQQHDQGVVPNTTKGKLGLALATFAPTALGAIFGGTAGAAGAAEGTVQAQGLQRDQSNLQRKSLQEQMENERQRQEREKLLGIQTNEKAREFNQRDNEFNQTQQRLVSEGEKTRSLQRELATQKHEPEPFTLSPGQQRVGPDGKIIASIPEKAATPQGFTLSPGEQRFGPAGESLASVPARAPAGPAPDYEWVLRGDQPVQIRKGSAQFGDRPYDAVANRQQQDNAPSPYAAERATRTIQSVDELIGRVSHWNTGAGSILSHLPETDARNFKAELDTLKANIAFNELTQMREASKTGGALGAVSDREGQLLQSALGALDTGQSPENIRGQLQKIKDSVLRWQTQAAQPHHAQPGSAAPGPKSLKTDLAPKKGDVQDGYVFQGGDPANPQSWKKK